MKFSSILSVLALGAAVVAQETEEPVEEVVNVPSAEKVVAVLTFPGTPSEQTPEIINFVETDLKFFMYNGEEFPLTILGYGGEIVYAADGALLTNLTSTQLRATEVKPSESADVNHKIKLNVPPGDYTVKPLLYLSNPEGRFFQMTVRPIDISVADAAVSVFDPRLFVAALLVAASLGAALYYGGIFALKYFGYSAPKTKKTTAKSAPKVEVTATPSESWIPEHHLKTQNQPRKRKV